MKRVEGRIALGLALALIIGITTPSHPLNLALLVPLAWIYSTSGARLALACAWLVGVVLAPTAVQPILESAPLQEVVTVVGVPELGPDSTRLTLDTSTGRVRARLEGRPDVAAGERLLVQGTVRPPMPGLESLYSSRGLRGFLAIKSWNSVHAAPAPFQVAERVRRRFVAFVEACFEPSVAAEIEALCFNLSTMLDDDTASKLRRTGTVHIVSASGLHVAVLLFATVWFLSRMPIPRESQLAIAVTLLIVYAIGTGLSAPVIRASLMALLVLGSSFVRREPDPLSALSVAAIIYLLWQPSGVFDVGFQLSFVTVGGLFMAMQHRSKRPVQVLPWAAHHAISAVELSVVACLVSAPLVAYSFGQIPLIGLVSNLMIGIAVSWIVVGGFLAFGLGMLGATLAVPILWLLDGWARWVLLVLDAASSPSWATLPVPEFNGYLLLPVYGAAFLLWHPKPRPV